MKTLLFLALIPSLLCAQRAHFGSIHTGGSGSPGDLSTKVEDVEELVFSNLLMTNGAAFDFGPYADVVALQAADFEKLRFQINARHSAGTIVSDSFTSEFPLSEVTGDVRVILTEVAGAEANLKMTGTTGGTLTLSGVYNSTASVKIWAVKAQKTVINTTDTPVNDQSSSGYIDIGDTRIQWGNFENTTSAPVQTLPAPFSDQNYSITTTVHENAKLFSNAFSITSTSFRSAIWSDSGVATNGTVSWQAIGKKP